jgi:hypothetical protein
MAWMCWMSGVAAAFFAFEFERWRAAVTATDICSFLDWDFVGGDEQREARRKAIADEQGFTVEHINGAFEFASGVRKSRVTSKLINLYEMSPSGVRQPKVRSCFCAIHYFAPPRPDPCIRKAVQADQAPLYRGVAPRSSIRLSHTFRSCAWLAPWTRTAGVGG